MTDPAWQVLAICSALVVGLIGAIYALLLWEIRRVGKNLHALRTQIGEMLLPIEKDVRALQIDVASLKAQHQEAEGWRDMVMSMLRGRP